METGRKTIQKSSNIDKKFNNELSIQASLNGLSFCIVDKFINSPIYYNHIPFNKKQTPDKILDILKVELSNEAIYDKDFHSVRVIHDNELSTVVPKPLFNEELIADYLKFNSRILRTDYITFYEIALSDNVNVYIPYININNYIYEKFGEFVYHHFSTILLEKLLATHKNSTGALMFAHISVNRHFEIIVIDEGKLKLYNSFEYASKEDFIYYILFVAEQLELNPEEFELQLIGNSDGHSELYKIAYTYVRNTKVATYPTPLEIKSAQKGLEKNIVLLNSF